MALVVSANAQDRIFWGVNGAGASISSSRLDGSDVQKSVSLSTTQGYDMETDFYKNILYFGDGAFVKSCNWDGTNIQTIYTATSGFMIGGLALDLKNNKLYYSQFQQNIGVITIMRSNLDGTALETVVTSTAGQTYNLAISQSLQKLYWAVSSGLSTVIYRSNLDGSNVEALTTIATFVPGICIDDENQKLYLAYWQNNEVRMTDMTCSTVPALLFSASQGTFQMSVSNIENKLYFGEMSTKKIRKCNLDGTSPQDIITLPAGQIMALSVPTVPPAPTIIENEKYTFKLNDFLFSNIDKDLITKIQITATVDHGTLYLDLNSNNVVDAGETVELNDEILKSDIVAGNLKFNPVDDEFGTPYTSFKFKWFNGSIYSTLEYTQYIYVLEYIAGDKNRNGIIDNGEKTGDINLDGIINRPTEVAGDRDGNGVIDYPAELAGDVNGDGTINVPTEKAGDLNGNGTIDRPDEAAGDVTGDGTITSPELAGDLNGDLAIVAPEILGDINGDGILNDGTAPSVTTQDVTDLAATTATGNGNITSLGSSDPTQYGVVWSTSVNPTVALTTKTTQGAISATGAFTSSITGLLENTTYYVKAYATNIAGTSYGEEKSFNTPSSCVNPVSGGIIVSDQSGCSPFDPAEIISSAPVKGFTGSLEYQWQSSADNIEFISIEGAVSEAYNPGDLTSTTWFKRLSKAGCMTDWTGAAESNVVKIEVYPIPETPEITLAGDILTSNAIAGNQWYLEGVAIDGATGKEYTAIADGNYTVVVTLDGCSSAASNSQLFLPASVRDFEISKSFDVYPNPGKGQFSIKIMSAKPAELTIEISNNIGVPVWKQEKANINGTCVIPVNLGAVSNGIYFVTLRYSTTTITQKVVIVK